MTENSKILAIVEQDHEPQTVVDRAIWLAKLNECDLELLYYEPPFAPLGSGLYLSNEAKEIGKAIKQVQTQAIEEFAEQSRKKGVKTTTEVVNERFFAEAILARTAKIGPQFVVKGSRYHSASKRGMVVDTDWQLMRVCPCPLWLVKSREFRDQPVVIAAVNPRHESDLYKTHDDVIVEKAMYITETSDSELHLFHSYQRLLGVGKKVLKTFNPVKIKIDEIDQRIKTKHREALDTLAGQYGIDAEHVHQLPGRTHELLPAFARSIKADVVVMGALARWDITRTAIGSTAERVIDHLPCDVLIVH